MPVEDRQGPLLGEDLSYHVSEKSVLASCREDAPKALEAAAAVLTEEGESRRGWGVFFISPPRWLIKRQALCI